MDKRDQCDLAPDGWRCTRQMGHDGPCAGFPMGSTAAEWIDNDDDQPDRYDDGYRAGWAAAMSTKPSRFPWLMAGVWLGIIIGVMMMQMRGQ